MPKRRRRGSYEQENQSDRRVWQEKIRLHRGSEEMPEGTEIKKWIEQENLRNALSKNTSQGRRCCNELPGKIFFLIRNGADALANTSPKQEFFSLNAKENAGIVELCRGFLTKFGGKRSVLAQDVSNTAAP